MNKIFNLLILAIIVLVSASCKTEHKFEQLFNGLNLENWNLFIGNQPQLTPSDIFSVVEINGDKLIRISGETNGSLATKQSFENYHLRMVFRWGEQVSSKRNSGLLYHSFGDFGAAFGVWMTNIEFQMMHKNLGDTYLMLNTTCETNALNDGKNYIYNSNAKPVQFGQHAAGSSIKKSDDNENPLGEWNTLDLYCFGTTSVHVVNGNAVMVNNNTGTYIDGEIVPLSSGKIQIQSEGAELFIKSVEIKSINKLPELN
ncbi:MAG TPA: DUF1080 domain-containing protein [Prolixibacteraceae bacterium]|nr:DUF1080 domain-containing protein [Prolixibacteraceae bacterium]HPR60501.1 DUF1080 domain-containing protein [Prolixibacteraceae bacterium]